MAPTADQLVSACTKFLSAVSNNTSPLAHFSTTHPVSIQHCPARCINPHSFLLRGPNAVRSYFDLLATHWTRSKLNIHTVVPHPAQARVIAKGSVVWTWKRSGRSWREDFTCTLVFEDSDPAALRILSFMVITESAPGTCVMHAVDEDVHDTSVVGTHPIGVWICCYLPQLPTD
jgi:hypothetical protein